MIAVHRPSHAFGIGYALWVRGRWSFATAWALVLALAFASNLSPMLQLPLGGGLHIPPIILAVPVLMLPIVSLLNVFTYGPIDVSSKASPFPMHARLLPMSTRALVGWPMLFSVVTLASLWTALLLLVLRPLGLTTSIVWPTTIVIACTAWVQAAAWIPLPFRFLRAPMFLAFVGIPLCFATVDPRSGDYFWSFEAVMAGWAALAYLLAMIGLKAARTGTSILPEWSWRATSSRSVVATAPFASAGAARRWYELRRTTSFFAKAFGIATLPLIALCLLAIRYPHSVFAYRMGGLPVSSAWAATYVVLGPLLASAAMGGFVARLDVSKDAGMASFFVLRPVSTARLVVDKLVSAAFAAVLLFASSAIVAALAFWVYCANAPPSVEASLDHFFANGGAVDIALIAAAFALLLWRNLAVDLWTTMTGRRWPGRVVAGCAGLAAFGWPAATAWLQAYPEVRHELVAGGPWLIRGLLVVKLIAAAVIASKLVRGGIVSPRVVATFGAGWCIATAVILAVVSRFTDVSATIACAVATLVPIARIGLAPLALDKSRHG